MYLDLILVFIFFACLAFLYNGGLWSNTITLVNVVTAALLASSFFEPLAGWAQAQWPAATYVCDFLSIWAVFALAMGLMRAITDSISTVKVRFKRPIELGGGMFVAMWIGWVMVCFTLMTLHTAPLARNSMGGAFAPTPTAKMFLGFGPDQKWLAFVHKMSKGTFSRSKMNPFDPQGEFVFKYGARRENFEKVNTVLVNP